MKLPERATNLVGRTRDIEELADAIHQSALVALVGAPGVGKSRMAFEIAWHTESTWDDVWWVDLADVADDTAVADVVCRAIGSSQGLAADLDARSATGRGVLLVLDNCEHLVGACAKLVEELGPRYSKLSILVTSRRALRLPGERTWPVPPLSLPHSGGLADLEESDAARFFCERASAMHPAFDACTDPESVAAICRSLAGIPLFLELAASRLDVLTTTELVRHLDEGLDVLASRTHGPAKQHHSARASLEWSYRLLSPQEQALFRRLAVFARGCTLAAAQEVCAGGGLDREEILDLLGALVQHSLVVPHRSSTPTRYRLLEPIRRYASEKLDDGGEATRVHSRHLSWCIPLAVGLSTLRHSSTTDLEHHGAGYQDICAALEWATSKGKATQALSLVGKLSPFWERRGDLAEARRWFEATAAACTGRQPDMQARAAYGAARFALAQGDLAAATRHAQASVESASKVGTPTCELSVFGLVTAFARGGRLALATLDEALAGAEPADAAALPDLLAACGTAHWMIGDPIAAREAFETCLETARSLGNTPVTSWAKQGLGWAALATGEYDLAEHLLREALEGAGDLGKVQEEAVTVGLLGDLERARRDTARARAYYEDGLTRARTIGARWPLTTCLVGLGWLAVAERDHVRAAELFKEARPVAEQSGIWLGRAQVLQALGALAHLEGRPGPAELQLREALAIARQAGGSRAEADALHHLAVLALAQGNHKAAEAMHDSALALRHAMNDRAGVLSSLEGIARVAVVVGRWREAARLSGGAHTLRRALLREQAAADEQVNLLDVEQTARRELGPDQFETEWSTGATVPTDDLVAYALRRRGPRRAGAEGWASLTRAERQIATLVAQGLTNKEVGERLFISHRTVGTHLKNIFSKLGIDSRRELRDKIPEGGPVPQT